MYKAYGSLSCLLVGKLLTFTNMVVTANCKLKLEHVCYWLFMQMSQLAPSLRNLHNVTSSVFSGGVWAQTILLDVPIFTSWMFSTCVMKLKAIVRFSSFWMWPTGFGWYLHGKRNKTIRVATCMGEKFIATVVPSGSWTRVYSIKSQFMYIAEMSCCGTCIPTCVIFLQDVAYKGGGTRGP